MTVKHQPSFIKWRFYLILSFILLVVMGLAWRLFDLTILDAGFLMQQGNDRVLRKVSTPAFRGMIVDRHGYPLAVSTRVYSIWVNPMEFDASSKQLRTLAKLLELKPDSIKKLITREYKRKREFAYLKRNLAPELRDKINNLKINGVYAQEGYRRFYPEGEVVSHVIGFTNIDDSGQEGLELAYNDWLSGDRGQKWVIKDRLGRIISEVRQEKEQKPGHDLVLSIDRRIQYLAYRELLDGVTRTNASSGTAIVLDAKTGEVLAMANLPSFNPNQRPTTLSNVYRNRAITDSFEPGSTIKAFSVASALDSGLFKPDTVIDTYPGWLRVGHNVVRDEHTKGPMTLRMILQKSSNVGVTKMVLAMPPNQLWSLLHRVGFGEITGVGFPGEQDGTLVKHNPWGSFTLATLAFGYGIAVTPLQLARAYSVFGNHGEILPVSLLKLDKKPDGKQVITPRLASQMLDLLEAVLEKDGTGYAARIPGYRVAGKTGTSIVSGKDGYKSKNKEYISSFIGIAPASNPRLVVAVIIGEPKGKQYYGGQVSGPVFAKIMEGSLHALDIAPDDLASTA